MENTARGPTWAVDLKRTLTDSLPTAHPVSFPKWLGSVGLQSEVSKGPISTPQYASEGLVIADMGTVLFCLRLLWDVDAKLRKQLGRRGELVTLIVLILNTIDMKTVPVLELRSDLKELVATTVKLPAALHASLKFVASSRQSSMNALVNSAIWVYTEERSKKG